MIQNLVNCDRWSLGKAARALGADPATVWRWCKNGVKVEGERIRLNIIGLAGGYSPPRRHVTSSSRP